MVSRLRADGARLLILPATHGPTAAQAAAITSGGTAARGPATRPSTAGTASANRPSAARRVRTRHASSCSARDASRAVALQALRALVVSVECSMAMTLTMTKKVVGKRKSSFAHVV